MSKTVRQILSPEQVARWDKIKEQHEAGNQRLRDERQRNDVLLRPDGDVDVTNVEAQKGRVLHRSEFVRRIRKLNPALWYEQSLAYPDRGALYIMDPARRMVCAFPHEYINEFSVPLTVPDVIPDPTVALHWNTIRRVDQKIPGWRSVLVKLILGRHITGAGVEKEFQIARGRSSQKWQQALS